MTQESLVTTFLRRLRSSGIFVPPSKRLPGNWQLYEFYMEPGEELINIKEEDIKSKGFAWKIKFGEHGQLSQEKNLPECISNGFNQDNWHVSGNFISFSGKGKDLLPEKFQFAIVNGHLRMLKKDSTGRIEFFGFFRKV